MDMVTINQNRISFILSCSDADDQAGILELYNMVSALYKSWGLNLTPEVETSIKLDRNSINRNRYSIPIYPCMKLSPDRTNQVLHSMGAPAKLVETINSRHKEKIAMIVSIDYDNSIKKIYLRYDNKTEIGYRFKSGLSFDYRIYRKFGKDSFEDILNDLQDILRSPQILNRVLTIMPSEIWSAVEAKISTTATGKSLTFYNILSSRISKLSDIEDLLIELVNYSNPDINKSSFLSWLKDAADNYLVWLGLGRNVDDDLEVIFYIRDQAGIYV